MFEVMSRLRQYVRQPGYLKSANNRYRSNTLRIADDNRKGLTRQHVPEALCSPETFGCYGCRQQALIVHGDSLHSTKFCRRTSSYLERPHTVPYITRQYLIRLISSALYFCSFNNLSKSDLEALKIVPCLCPFGTEIL